MEAATAPEQIPAFDLGVKDANGSPLSSNDRVQVTGSSRFGTGNGTVIGYVRQNKGTEDVRVVDGELRDMADAANVRIRVLMDNGTDGDNYTASQGRVTKLDPENDGSDPAAADEPDEPDEE